MGKTVVVWGLAACALLGSEGIAAAQARPFVAGFAGSGRIPALDIAVSDPTIAADVAIRGRKVDAPAVWGGSVGIWNSPQGARWAWGIRGDVAHQGIEANAQTVTASGRLFGQPFSGPVPVPAGDGSMTLMNGVFLLGAKTGADARVRVMPYAGAGGGVGRARITFPASPGLPPESDTDVTWVAQVVGGLDVSLAERAALYGEYRFTHLGEHVFLLGSQRNALSLSPHHVVAGVRLSF